MTNVSIAGLFQFLPSNDRLRLFCRKSKNVSGLAIECSTQLLQHVCPEHSGLAVSEREKSGITNARFFSQTIKRPALAFQERVESGNNHWSSIATKPAVCKLNLLYNIYFTQGGNFSRLKGQGYSPWTASCSTSPWRAAGPANGLTGRLTPNRGLKRALVAPGCGPAGRLRPGSSRLRGLRVRPGGLGGVLWTAY
jgi:hypothetical protein